MDKQLIEEMRSWIADCVWGDLEQEDIDTLTEAQIVNGIKKHYAGGVDQFLKDGGN